ncbi:hypothetical protein COB55_01560 [Candidatus Wolfebacteria bacterium]|nr:MAG: hypothetical protein COB55_01560 [Candidatus Wolfebacteria bacterium]
MKRIVLIALIWGAFVLTVLALINLMFIESLTFAVLYVIVLVFLAVLLYRSTSEISQCMRKGYFWIGLGVTSVCLLCESVILGVSLGGAYTPKGVWTITQSRGGNTYNVYEPDKFIFMEKRLARIPREIKMAGMIPSGEIDQSTNQYIVSAQNQGDKSLKVSLKVVQNLLEDDVHPSSVESSLRKGKARILEHLIANQKMLRTGMTNNIVPLEVQDIYLRPLVTWWFDSPETFVFEVSRSNGQLPSPYYVTNMPSLKQPYVW